MRTSCRRLAQGWPPPRLKSRLPSGGSVTPLVCHLTGKIWALCLAERSRRFCTCSYKSCWATKNYGIKTLKERDASGPQLQGFPKRDSLRLCSCLSAWRSWNKSMSTDLNASEHSPLLRRGHFGAVHFIGTDRGIGSNTPPLESTLAKLQLIKKWLGNNILSNLV